MSIHVNCFDLVEVKYLDDKNEEKVEFFSYIEGAKDFIKNSKEVNFSIISATYFIELMIGSPNSHLSRMPAKRFGEQKFSSEEFLRVSTEWVEKTRKNANQEIDAYMAEHYPGATPQL